MAITGQAETQTGIDQIHLAAGGQRAGGVLVTRRAELHAFTQAVGQLQRHLRQPARVKRGHLHHPRHTRQVGARGQGVGEQGVVGRALGIGAVQVVEVDDQGVGGGCGHWRGRQGRNTHNTGSGKVVEAHGLGSPRAQGVQKADRPITDSTPCVTSFWNGAAPTPVPPSANEWPLWPSVVTQDLPPS